MFVYFRQLVVRSVCDMILFSGYSSLRDYYVTQGKIFQVFVSVSFFQIRQFKFKTDVCACN